MAKKLIKNYTTDTPVLTTLAEIQKILAENGAMGIATEYKNGAVQALFFRIPYRNQELAFRLPARPEQVYAALFANMQYEDRLREQRMERSRMIAWRICKTWLEAQITLVNLGQAKMEEVFLPYFVMDGQKTLYESMESGGFLLSSGKG